MIMIFPRSIHTLTVEDMVACVRISSLFIQMTIFFNYTQFYGFIGFNKCQDAIWYHEHATT